MLTPSRVALGILSGLAFVSTVASAHIDMTYPTPRYPVERPGGAGSKACPCGSGEGNRRCDTTADMSTDPNRSMNVTTFEAGSQITVRVEEFIDHAGRIRVAFDRDGADLSDFNANILVDIPDPDENTITLDAPRVWEIPVTLPSENCENCTLQVIQVMNEITDVPVMDPAPLSTYYACADIRLTGGTAPAAGAGGMGGAVTGAAGALMSDSADDEEDDGGCSMRPGETTGAAGLATLGLIGAVLLRRRRH